MNKEKKLHSLISNHYFHIEKDIEMWYNTINRLLDPTKTPKELIEHGQIDKVFEYVRNILN